MGFFFSFFSYLWKDGEKVTAELQEKGVHRSAVQAAFKATFWDKKIKHNQSNNFPFLLPERPRKISAFRRTEGEAAPWTRQSITHQPPVTAPDSSPVRERRTLAGCVLCYIWRLFFYKNLALFVFPIQKESFSCSWKPGANKYPRAQRNLWVVKWRSSSRKAEKIYVGFGGVAFIFALCAGLELRIGSWEWVKQKPALYRLLVKISWGNTVQSNKQTHKT